MIAGAAAAIILSLLAVIHVYWALGGALGKSGAIPHTRDGKPVFTPTPFTTLLVALGLLVMAALNGVKIGWIAAPRQFQDSFVRYGLWLTAAIFLLRAIRRFSLHPDFFKRHRESRFAKLDTLLYSPLCLLLACLVAISADS